MIEKAKEVAIGIILLIAIIVPFLSLGAGQNSTIAGLGLPAAAWSGIMLLILVVYVFNLVKTHKK